MQRQRNRWLSVVGLALVLHACAGGSGSSGFDVSSAETAAIREVLTTGRCVPVSDTELTVCPADVASPQGAPGSVMAGVDPASAVPCVLSAADSCAFTFPFMADGFPPEAVYRVATRSIDPLGAWRVSAAPTANPAPGSAPDFDVPVLIERPSDAPTGSSSVQLAVLVYLAAPSSIPSTVNTLVESGADFAYVVTPIDVLVVQ